MTAKPGVPSASAVSCLPFRQTQRGFSGRSGRRHGGRRPIRGWRLSCPGSPQRGAPGSAPDRMRRRLPLL